MTDYPEAETDRDMYITEEMTHWIIKVLSDPRAYSADSVAEANRQATLFKAQCDRELRQ